LWPCGLIASPLTGPAGNHEYLLWLRSKQEPAGEPVTPDSIRALVHRTLSTG
jgi:23S rRNA (cytidine1920-2'-O)/16S rRNA (cytidine1409-2'-O)-methyltransferase